MRYRIYANGKFVGYGHADDVMIAQLQYGKENVTAEKIEGKNYCVRKDY